MRRALAVLVALAFALIPVSASATEGSVPAVVSDYIAHDLGDALNEFYGPGTDGDGTLFDDSTTYSSTSRVWAWTSDFEAGIDSKPATRMLNEWVTVVSVEQVVVGVATVSIDPVTNGAELANYLGSPELAAALVVAPATSMMLRDLQREAWLAVEGDTVTPLVAGQSGLSAPSTVAAYRALVSVQKPLAQQAEATPVSVAGVVVAGVAIVVVVVLLALQRFVVRRRVAPDALDHVL